MFRKVKESQTLLINAQSKQLIDKKIDVIKFGFGQSPFLPPPRVVDALKLASNRKEYSSVQGNIELRDLIVKFHHEHNGISCEADNVLLGPGSKILLYNILLSFQVADVLVPAPAWVSYGPQVELIGHNLIKIRTSFNKRWRVTPEELLRSLSKCKTKQQILILNYPGNPDGLTYSKDELEELSEIARDWGMLIISDEIYGLLDHYSSHVSMATIYPERTITTTGLSKWCGAGGWRFGVALLYDDVEPALKRALIGIGSETYSCAPMPIQEAAKEAYASFEMMKPYLAWQTGILKELARECTEKLHKVGINVHNPTGGFYMFPEFSYFKRKLETKGITTSEELCTRLLNETGVALLPANAFGFENEYLAARLAYVDFSPPDPGQKWESDRDSIRVRDGINRITNWILSI